MWTVQFWQSWPRAHRLFLLLFASLFVVALISMWVAHFQEPAPAIELQTIQETDFSEIPVDQFRIGPFDLSVRGNNYVIIQRQLGSMLEISETVAYVYLVAMAVFMIGMLAVISTLSRFYYLAGMGIFILFVTSLSTELLGVLGNYGKMFTIVVMAFYALASFYLFYFVTTASFLVRVLVFTAITVVLGLVIQFLSVTESPFLHIATHSAQAGLIATALFIATVSHEIIAAFVFAVTQSRTRTKSLQHFAIISLIYFINLVLAYSIRFGFLRWDVITIDLYLLLTISGILGVWGIRQRQKTFEGILDADPYGVFAFLLVGCFAFATIAMFMFNGNDTALAAIGDIIIFMHLGFGFIFLIYIISNFLGVLEKNYAVHKVLYTPNNMPYFTFRFGGLITTLALLIYNTWQVPIHNAMSGYYNGVADLYMHLDNDRIATAYYNESRTYGFRGHHSNYALANIASARFDPTDERKYYEDASWSRATQMSYLNWAQTYQTQNENLTAIVTLTEGAKKLKDHEALDNTLGILYARMGLSDSASRYLDRSMASSRYRQMASANKIGLIALRQIQASYDSSAGPDGDPVVSVNKLGLLNSLGKTGGGYTLPTDTVLNLAQAAQLSNYLVNQRYSYDTALFSKAMVLARRPSNVGFREAILFASSIALYNSGETKEAFKTLEEVTVSSELKGKYNNILTMWALENGELARALAYADYALTQNHVPAKTTYAVTLTEQLASGISSNPGPAISAWDSLVTSSDTITSQLAKRIRSLLLLPSQQIHLMSDEDKYVFARYRLAPKDSLALFELATSVKDEDIRGRIYLDHAQKLYRMDYPSKARQALSKIIGLSLSDRSIGDQLAILDVLTAIRVGRVAEVLEGVKKEPIRFAPKERKYNVYLDALTAQAAGDTTTAARHYRWLGTANPWFEDGLIAAAEYFRNKGFTSYNMLADGLLYHPSSIKIRKAYALESARQGLGDYARTELDELKSLIDPKMHADLTAQVNKLLERED